MRNMFVVIAILFFLGFTGYSDAQISLNIHFNLNSQPDWGPAGYDYVEYYYLPDIDVYYSVPLHRFYYFEEGRWVCSIYLPERYRHYDLYNSYKVVINRHDPWRHDRMYREKYFTYRNRRSRPAIGNPRDNDLHDNHWRDKNNYKHGRDDNDR